MNGPQSGLRLPALVAALNGEVTRLIGKKPSEAVKTKSVTQKPSGGSWSPKLALSSKRSLQCGEG